MKANPPGMRQATLLILLALCVPGALLPACTPAATALPTPAQDEQRALESAVYTALFEAIYGTPRMYVLSENTSPALEGVAGLEGAVMTILPQLAGLEQATLASFGERNQNADALAADMDLGLPYVLLSAAEYDEIFAINTSSWDVFYTRFPNSPGLTTVSRVGFNEDWSQALVYVGTISHWKSGSGMYVLLGNSSGTWQVVEQVLAWIS
jgi:hypothetical protein